MMRSGLLQGIITGLVQHASLHAFGKVGETPLVGVAGRLEMGDLQIAPGQQANI